MILLTLNDPPKAQGNQKPLFIRPLPHSRLPANYEGNQLLHEGTYLHSTIDISHWFCKLAVWNMIGCCNMDRCQIYALKI